MPLRHIASSAAILALPESCLDMVRVGALLYGLLPGSHFAGMVDVRPVLAFHSCVVYFKVVKKDAGVSYNHLWHAPCDTRVVTIPIGYGDGFFRRLTNLGHVLIRGKRYPIVGRVCMDQFMVNLGPDGEAYNGDEVVLIGSQGQEQITASEIAQLTGADVREVLVNINSRVPRRYINVGQ